MAYDEEKSLINLKDKRTLILFSMNRPVTWQLILYMTCVLIGLHLLKPYFSSHQQPWFFLSTILFSLSSLFQCNKKNITLVTGILFILLLFLITPLSIDDYSQRIQSISIGFMLSLFCQLVCLVRFSHREFFHEWRYFLNNLNQLADDYFTCLLESEYGTHIYKYERRIHFSKNKIWYSLNKMNYLKNRNSLILRSHANQLIAILFSLGQIRYRISDHTVFLVCRSDLQNLQDAIAQCFRAQSNLSRSCSIELDKLNKAIKHFESTYQSVLQVTSPEPLGILLFIFDLYRLHNELREIDLNEYSI